MLNFPGTAGVNTGDTIYESKQRIEDYNEHVIEATAGTVTVHVSLDGENYSAAIAVEDLTNAGASGRPTVASLAAGGVGMLRGHFKKVQVLQSGATASNARITHSVS